MRLQPVNCILVLSIVAAASATGCRSSKPDSLNFSSANATPPSQQYAAPHPSPPNQQGYAAAQYIPPPLTRSDSTSAQPQYEAASYVPSPAAPTPYDRTPQSTNTYGYAPTTAPPSNVPDLTASSYSSAAYSSTYSEPSSASADKWSRLNSSGASAPSSCSSGCCPH